VLPTNEIDGLTMTVSAEEIAEEEVGWGTELVSRWRPACENYAREHGVKIQ